MYYRWGTVRQNC